MVPQNEYFACLMVRGNGHADPTSSLDCMLCSRKTQDSDSDSGKLKTRDMCLLGSEQIF